MKRLLLLALIVSTGRVFAAATPPSLEVRPVGTPLDDAIVSIYVPPTRANNVYAATRSAVQAYSAKSGEWKRIFPPPGESAAVAGVAGYAKASSVIYVAHDKGVSMTHDGGETWETALPEGYRVGKAEAATISVNPTSREEAVVSTGHGAWFTKDYGKTWGALAGPAAGTAPTEVRFVADPAAGLIARSKNGLYQAKELAGSWQQLAPQAVAAAIAPGSGGTVVFADQKKTLKRIINGTSDRGTSLPAEPGLLALDDSGSAWLGHGKKLYAQPGVESAAELAATLDADISAIVAHPRAPHAVVLAARNQVYVCGDVPEATEPGGSKDDATGAVAQATPDSSGAQALFDAARAASPPLPVVVDAALDFADYHADDVEKWRKHVRLKSLLPSVNLELGERQWPANVYNTAYSTNQYGITTANDITQDDRIANLDRNSVQLRWDFSKLLFDVDQLHISEEARRRATDRNALIKEVTQLYYKRLELLVKQKQEAGKSGADDELQVIMQLSQSTDLLNEICGRELFTPTSGNDKGTEKR